MIHSALLCFFLYTSSVYNLSIDTYNKGIISLSDYHGKKILIVNIASNSKYVSQVQELHQLYDLHKDSLIVIAFPSNSFDNEQRDDAQLLQYVDSMQLNFPVAKLSFVKGGGIHPLYAWLSQRSSNGVLDATITNDFQKYFLDKNGEIFGLFNSEVSPLDTKVTQAITTNF